MAGHKKLEIIEGDVVSVQFTTETHTHHGPQGGRRRGGRRARAPQGLSQIINRTRLFLRLPNGKERDFLIEECRVGLHEGHHVALAYGKGRGMRQPVLLAIVNASTGQREERAPAVFAVLGERPLFGPYAKAVFLSALMFLIGWFISEWVMRGGASGAASIAWALFFAFLTYPAFWAIAWVWERFAAKARQTKAMTALRAALPIKPSEPEPEGAPAPATQT